MSKYAVNSWPKRNVPPRKADKLGRWQSKRLKPRCRLSWRTKSRYDESWPAYTRLLSAKRALIASLGNPDFHEIGAPLLPRHRLILVLREPLLPWLFSLFDKLWPRFIQFDYWLRHLRCET